MIMSRSATYVDIIMTMSRLGLCYGPWHGRMQAFGSRLREQIKHRSRERRYGYFSMSECNAPYYLHLPKEVLAGLLKRTGGAQWICHMEMLWAAAHGCVHCVRSYVRKKGSKIDDGREERVLGVWHGTEDDATYNAWKATFYNQNGHSFASQEEVRRFLLEQPDALKHIQRWEDHEEDTYGVHKQMLARRESLKKWHQGKRKAAADANPQEHGSSSDARGDEDGLRQSRSSDGASSWQRVGGTPGGEAGPEESRWESRETPWQKDGGMPAGTASRSDSEVGSGACGWWSASQWCGPWWLEQEGEDEQFCRFLEACKKGDAEAVKDAVAKDPWIAMRIRKDPISGFEMRGSDFATMGRLAGCACLDVLNILQRTEEQLLKTIWNSKA